MSTSDNEHIGEIADLVRKIIGSDREIYEQSSSNDIGRLLHDMSKSADPADNPNDFVFWEVDDAFKGLSEQDRQKVPEMIVRDYEKVRAREFIDRWKKVRVRQ